MLATCRIRPGIQVLALTLVASSAVAQQTPARPDDTLRTLGAGIPGEGSTPARWTPPTGPAPRTASGRPDFRGVWDHPYVPDMAASSARDPAAQKGAGALPYTPAALENITRYNPERDGDTLVIDTIGFNGWTRLDTRGNPHSDTLHMVQTFRRVDAGHLAYTVTIEGPVYYERPWTNERTFTLTNGDLIEYSCEENNRSRGKAASSSGSRPPPSLCAARWWDRSDRRTSGGSGSIYD